MEAAAQPAVASAASLRPGGRRGGRRGQVRRGRRAHARRSATRPQGDRKQAPRGDGRVGGRGREREFASAHGSTVYRYPAADGDLRLAFRGDHRAQSPPAGCAGLRCRDEDGPSSSPLPRTRRRKALPRTACEVPGRGRPRASQRTHGPGALPGRVCRSIVEAPAPPKFALPLATRFFAEARLLRRSAPRRCPPWHARVLICDPRAAQEACERAERGEAGARRAHTRECRRVRTRRRAAVRATAVPTTARLVRRRSRAKKRGADDGARRSLQLRHGGAHDWRRQRHAPAWVRLGAGLERTQAGSVREQYRGHRGHRGRGTRLVREARRRHLGAQEKTTAVPGFASASARIEDANKPRPSYVKQVNAWDTFERVDTEFAKLGLRGVTVVAASGDNGPFSFESRTVPIVVLARHAVLVPALVPGLHAKTSSPSAAPPGEGPVQARARRRRRERRGWPPAAASPTSSRSRVAEARCAAVLEAARLRPAAGELLQRQQPGLPGRRARRRGHRRRVRGVRRGDAWCGKILPPVRREHKNARDTLAGRILAPFRGRRARATRAALPHREPARPTPRRCSRG